MKSLATGEKGQYLRLNCRLLNLNWKIKSLWNSNMKAILVFIDGTTCDMRHRITLQGADDFFSDENIMKDIPTAGSVECMNELAENYHLVYMGARPSEYNEITAKWYTAKGFADGEVYCGKSQDERMNIVKYLKKKYEFYAGIGDRWMIMNSTLN